MEINNMQRVQVITEALPYIKKYYNKIIVVKYGGNAMINEELKEAVMGDLVLLALIGIKVVLVHGGGPEITEMLSKIGKKSEFVNGLRVTDKETVDIVQMVLAGKINKNLVNLIKILAERRLVYLVSKIRQAYMLAYDEHYNIERVDAISAIPLTSEQINKLQLKLEKVTGKQIVVTNTIDSSILGGMKLRYLGIQLDGSIKTKLDNFEKSLKDLVI